MKSLKSLIASICILAMVGMIVGVAVKAGTEATVTATVKVENISVSITANPTIGYGTMGQNATKGTHSGDMNTTIEATNDGNITENFLIRALPDASTPNWIIALDPATNGSNEYVHMFCKTSCTTPPTSYTALTVSNQSLATGIVATTGTQTFDLWINTPDPSTSFEQQSVNVIVVAEAGA